jgi:hypothetical protein
VRKNSSDEGVHGTGESFREQAKIVMIPTQPIIAANFRAVNFISIFSVSGLQWAKRIFSFGRCSVAPCSPVGC